MAVTAQDVQALYIAYFNRPADFLGLSFQLDQANKFGLKQVADQFAKSPEYLTTYANKSTAEVIDTIYMNLFGRHAEPDGIKFWGNLLLNGTVTMGNVALNIFNGAINDDKTTVQNKLSAAQSFYNSLDTSAEIVGYSGDAANGVLKTWLAGITDTASLTARTTDAALLAISTAATAAHDGSISGTLTLTNGVDTLVGSAGNDVFNANEVSTTAGLTGSLTALDNLDGGAGTDTLNVSATATAFDNTAAGLTIKNIEVANFQGTKAMTVDASAWTGLTNLNVTKSVADATLTVANTTDVNVANADAAVTVTGGKSVTVAQKMNAAADVIVINKAGAVTVTATDSNAAANAGAAGIKIGVGAGNAVTGAVAVTSTGAKIVGGVTGTVTLDSIEVTGGTTVSVTQAATADLGDVTTKGTLADAVVQGAVTVIGGAATTSVSVVQADQATAKAAVAAVTGVSATQVVTFKAMAANDTVIIDGLTFTASKALTAAEAAAAFAGLTSTENQGQGYSANGSYTGVTSANWNTSAVSGATVTYTQKVANTGTLAAPLATSAGTVPTPTAAAGATGVTAVTAVAGVLGVSNGLVTIDDNGATASIKSVVVDGYSAGANLGVNANLNALTNLTLANSGAGTAAVRTNAAALALTVNDVTSAVTLTDASLKTLNITAATKDSAFVLNTVTTVETLTVDGTNAVDLKTTALTGLKTVTVGGAAGLTVDASGANVTSVTTTTTGTVNATIDSTKATYTGGAGVDNVTLSNTTAAAKAISLGAGNDTLTLATGTTAVPTVTIDGGAGTDILAMAAADAAAVSTNGTFAAKFTGFEKLSLGAVVSGVANSVDLSFMNNINYVISAGSAAGVAAAPAAPTGVATQGAAATAESTTFTFGVGLAAGESFTIDGVTVTASAAKTNAEVAGFFRALGTPVAGLTSTGSFATPVTWTGAPVVSGATNTLILTNTANGDVTDFTTASSVGAPAAGTGTLTLTKFVNAGTLELTGAGTGAIVTMADATSLTADVLNVVTKLSTANLNYGTVDAAGVETINLSINDTAATTALGGIQTATLNLKDAALQTINVTGNANLTLTNDAGNVAVKLLDASTFTGVLNASTNGTVAETIKGGSGNDVLVAANTAANLADTLIGGAGNDTLTSNKGLTTMTGGAGVDTFIVGAASLNVNSYSTITDASVGDIIKFEGVIGTFAASKVALGATAVFQDFANAATVGNTTKALSWFQFGGDTYIVKDVDVNTSGFVNGSDMIVKLVGNIDLSHASYSATLGTIEIGA